MDHFAYKNGSLFCEDAAVADIVAEVGTPAYIYSTATLLHHYRAFADAFAELAPTICFSIKSLANLSVLKLLAAQGSAFDVTSGGELARAIEAGGDMAQVVFAGVGKTDAEIVAALDVGIGVFNIESEAEFENLSRLAALTGKQTHAALRLNPDVYDPKTHTYTATGKKESKFGVDIERAVRFFETYGRDANVVLDGIHIHIGSPIYSPDPYVAAIDGTDDALADRSLEPEWVAYREDLIADGHRLVIAERKFMQEGQVDAHDGEVGIVIDAEHRTHGFATVSEADTHRLGAIDDVSVRQSQAARRVVNETAADSATRPRYRIGLAGISVGPRGIRKRWQLGARPEEPVEIMFDVAGDRITGRYGRQLGFDAHHRGHGEPRHRAVGDGRIGLEVDQEHFAVHPGGRHAKAAECHLLGRVRQGRHGIDALDVGVVGGGGFPAGHFGGVDVG